MAITTTAPTTTMTQPDITTTARSPRDRRSAMILWRTARRGIGPTIRRREPISGMTGYGIPARRNRRTAQ